MTGQSAAEGSPCSHRLSVQTQEDEQDRAESVLSRSVILCLCVVCFQTKCPHNYSKKPIWWSSLWSSEAKCKRM